MSNIVKQINLHLKGNEVENIEELLSEAAEEIERLRAALEEIKNSPNELRDAKPSDYARGFNDGRWRMQQIARKSLAGEKTNE